MASLLTTHTTWLAGVLSLLLACSGCLRAITDERVDLADTAAESTSQPATREEQLQELEQLLATRITRRDAVTKTTSVEVADGWYRQVGSEDVWLTPRGEYRWQHDGLAALLKARDDDAAALSMAQKSDDPHVAHAATIGLARIQPLGQVKALGKIARNPQLSQSVRRAAVETLAQGESLEVEGELRKLLDVFGPNERGVCIDALLYAETLVGLSRHVAIDAELVFEEALATSDIDVQQAALAVFAESNSTLPPRVESLVKSQHARVRKAALVALAKTNHPAAVMHLSGAIKDADLLVRLGAIELLGKVKSHDAVLLLHDLANDSQERHREAAATALVAQQEWAAVQRAAGDSSYRVRLAVAAAIAPHGEQQQVALAKTLLADSSAMVQAKVCESLAKWPAELAVPLLCDALLSSNLLTRQTAQQSLLTHRVDVKDFNPGLPPGERSTYATALLKRWQDEHPFAAKAASVAAAQSGPSPEEIAGLVRQFQSPGDRSAKWIAQKQLERYGAAAVFPVLDKLIYEQQFELHATTRRELLPQLSTAMATIEGLRDPDVTRRRNAARTLAHEATLMPLPRLALDELSALARTESDSLVWTDLLRAVSQTRGAVAHELALAALAHREADVRRRACEYLAECGDERQAEALVRLTGDRDPVIVKAAVVALGRCGPPTSREALYALLDHQDPSLQVAAATTLSRWNDGRGSAALERLLHARSTAARRLAIAAMGELGKAEFVPALIVALEDHPSVRLAALNALPQVAGEDVLANASPLPVSADEKARVWKEWHAEQDAK